MVSDWSGALLEWEAELAALKRKIGSQHPREPLRLADTHLRTRIRMFAGLEDEPLVGADRLVAWVVVDFDNTDGEALLRLLLVLLDPLVLLPNSELRTTAMFAAWPFLSA